MRKVFLVIILWLTNLFPWKNNEISRADYRTFAIFTLTTILKTMRFSTKKAINLFWMYCRFPFQFTEHQKIIENKNVIITFFLFSIIWNVLSVGLFFSFANLFRPIMYTSYHLFIRIFLNKRKLELKTLELWNWNNRPLTFPVKLLVKFKL